MSKIFLSITLMFSASLAFGQMVPFAFWSAGSLVGSSSSGTTAFNLTTIGTTDWAHWGDISTGPSRKSSGGSLISDLTLINGIGSYANDARTFSWSDGTPTASGSETRGVLAINVGTGFTFSVPADTNQRTLIIYLGVYQSTGSFVASLSDGSAANYTMTSTNMGGSTNSTVTLTYTAASANQTLNIQWTMTAASGGNINLPAATLATTGSTGTGSLSGSSAASGATITLTTQGTADWVHWGWDFIRKSGGNQFSNLQSIGSVDNITAIYNNDARGASWSGGTPTVSGSGNINGMYLSQLGYGAGYLITAPASNVAKTLNLYVGGYQSGATLTAHLSDSSAADYVDVVALVPTSSYYRTYTLVYRSRAPTATLTITWLMTAGSNTGTSTGGNVTIKAAALQ